MPSADGEEPTNYLQLTGTKGRLFLAHHCHRQPLYRPQRAPVTQPRRRSLAPYSRPPDAVRLSSDSFRRKWDGVHGGRWTGSRFRLVDDACLASCGGRSRSAAASLRSVLRGHLRWACRLRVHEVARIKESFTVGVLAHSLEQLLGGQCRRGCWSD